MNCFKAYLVLTLLSVATPVLARGGGLISNYDGTVIRYSSRCAQSTCITQNGTITFHGDSLTYNNPGGAFTYTLGQNSFPGSHTSFVSIVGNTITFQVKTIGGYSSTSRLTLNGRSCSISISTGGSSSCQVVKGANAPEATSDATAQASGRSNQGSPSPSGEKACSDGVRYFEQLKARGEDVEQVRLGLAGQGCKVPPGSTKRSSRLRSCLSFRGRLSDQGLNDAAIAKQLKLADCPSF